MTVVCTDNMYISGNYGVVSAKITRIDNNTPFIKYKTTVFIEKPQNAIEIGCVIDGLFLASLPESSIDFDTFTYNKAKGIYLSLSPEGKFDISSDKRTSLSLLPKKVSNKIKDTYSGFLEPKMSAFCSALTTGDKSKIDYVTSESLNTAGLSHIICVSGMHISFIVGLLIAVFGKKYGSFAAVPCILFMMAMTGFSPSVMRSGIMNIVLIFSYILKRDKDTISALSMSVFIMLLFNPYAVLDIGFALSVGSSLGIILFSRSTERTLNSCIPSKLKSIEPLRYFFQFIISILSATISANIFSIPLCALFFGRISLISPIANILIVPIISVIFFLCAALGVVGLLSAGFASVIAMPLRVLLYYVFSMLGVIKSLPFACFSVENTYLLAITVIIYAFICICGRYLRDFKISEMLLFLSSLCMVGIVFTGITYRSTLFVSIFNANGPAVALRRGAKCVLVDCGDQYRGFAAKKIYSFLSLNGIPKADALILTEIDNSHAGAAAELIQNRAVKSLVFPTGNYKDYALAKSIYSAAIENGVPVYPLGAEIEFLDLNINIHNLTNGDRVSEINFSDFSFLSAHSDNIYVINKMCAKLNKSFDAALTSYKNLSSLSEINSFCRNVGAKMLIIPDKIYAGEPPAAQTDLFLLSKSGDMTIRVKK